MSVKSFFLGEKAEKYDHTTDQANEARNFGTNVNRAFDIQADQAGRTQMGRGEYNQTRSNQTGLLGQLAGQAQGQGPSAAGMAASAQRDSNLAQAAALQAGRRGQSAGAGIRAAGNSVIAGNQMAGQNEAIGRANEMNTARGQQLGLMGQMAGQDLAWSQGQANLDANREQSNAQLRQNAAWANQKTQVGIGQSEFDSRQRQENLSYSNLKPGTEGFASPQNVATGLTAALMPLSDKRSKSRIGKLDGSTGKAMSPGDAKKDIQLAGSSPGAHMYQPGGTIGAGTRVTPNWYVGSAAAYGQVLGSALANIMLAKSLDKNKDEEGKGPDAGGIMGMLQGAGGGGAAGAGGAGGAGAAGGAGGGAAAAAAMSDRRSKKEARQMLDKAPAYSYEYKDDAKAVGAPEGRQVSLMWDDLQKTPAGRRMDGPVEPKTGYHTVDYMKGLPTAFAALSDLNERVSKVEGRRMPKVVDRSSNTGRA